MRAVILFSAVCLTAFATTVVAQQPPAPPAPPAQPMAKPVAATTTQPVATALKPADVAGTWTFENSVKNTAGADTVVTSELTVSADAKTWVTHLANRDPIPSRVLAMAGDSVVTESGPFPSVARPGQTVTTHEVFHFKGGDVSGTIEARYSNGDVVKGSVKGKRKA